MFVVKKWREKGMSFYKVKDDNGKIYIIFGMKNLIKFLGENK
jgi:hypothetical protein